MKTIAENQMEETPATLPGRVPAVSHYPGMSKRYWTAVMIASGNFNANSHTTMESVVKLSFELADALLEQEDK